ncbi:MAG TPA: GNAT family N-acetyltransferase [Terriglobales bacterium]|nr:GNAT family N-acetyltransferase [Terriglobales bacterium]
MAELPDGRVVGGGGVVICPWPGTPTDHQPRRVWILNIYTEPDHRRRGVARRILEAILAWCRDNGCRSVSLHASNQGRKLYESLGFKPTNEMRLMLP